MPLSVVSKGVEGITSQQSSSCSHTINISELSGLPQPDATPQAVRARDRCARPAACKAKR